MTSVTTEIDVVVVVVVVDVTGDIFRYLLAYLWCIESKSNYVRGTHGPIYYGIIALTDICFFAPPYSHMNAHTQVGRYIYICVCVCVYVCMYVRSTL